MIFWTTRRRRVEHQGDVIDIHTTRLYGILPLRTVWQVYSPTHGLTLRGKAVNEESALHDALRSLVPQGPDGLSLLEQEGRPKKPLFGKET